jgi:hypothetical protein
MRTLHVQHNRFLDEDIGDVIQLKQGRTDLGGGPRSAKSGSFRHVSGGGHWPLLAREIDEL